MAVRRRVEEPATLSINSLMDIMTIILVFLLKSYSTDPVQFKPAPDLKIPFSNSAEAAVESTVITVTQNNVLIDDERVLQGNSTRSLVLMMPALQALAVLRDRDYVSSEDIQTLVPRVLGHRVDLAPGITELQPVLEEAMERSIEGLSRSTLRRR